MRIPSDCLREPDLENRCGTCHLCKWLKKPVVKAALVPTAERTLLVDTYASDTISDTPAFLSGADGLFLSKRRAISNMDAEPKTRLSRFIRLMGLLNKAPWANKSFSVNNAMLRRLIASHLPLIVGAAWQKHKSSLIDLIGSSDDLSTAQNIIWITNRQQGKTTTLSKFVAALSILSPVGGNLLCVYSTNLDRAQELTRAAKKYIYWLSECDAELADINVKLPVFTVDNERVYSISGENGVVNTVIARPKNPDSCRGDAPAAAIFDEIAFVTADFWFKFAYPLLQISKRVFTCATTPPEAGSFFSVFTDKVQIQNNQGDYFFRLINHSLVCHECAAAGIAEQCCHRLGLVPPWKSLLRFTRMKTLVPASRQADYEAEAR